MIRSILCRVISTQLLISAAVVVSHAQTLTTLVNFDGRNGIDPRGPLTQSTDGSLYGVTVAGGSSGINSSGTVFRLTPGGTLTTLHIFERGQDVPRAALVQGADGTGLSGYPVRRPCAPKHFRMKLFY
jgi:uncharacterized repeat protein (TIGR03803 family)